MYNVSNAVKELHKTMTSSVKTDDVCTKFQTRTPPEALLPKPTHLVPGDNTHTNLTDKTPSKLI
jgi:hypothetical protein